MRLTFLSLFPEMIEHALSHGVVGRSLGAKPGAVRFVDPRKFASDARGTVDEKPFGGGPGMLITAPVMEAAYVSILPLHEPNAVVALDAAGERFDQSVAAELAQKEEVVFLCGRYEGIDERFIARRATHRLSIGDFVLSGGEIPALAIADAIVRLLPGVLGDPGSLSIDSHSNGLLGPPQFTRPTEWEGVAVPDVLRSGDHGEVERWKRRQSLRSTRECRPDLFALAKLENGDADMLSS